jgi:predicted porin
MNKRLLQSGVGRHAVVFAGIAAALAGTAGAALAQSPVRVFGTIDASVERVATGDPGAAGTLRVSSGSGRTSRLVFEGNEDLGAGAYAKFFIDIGFWADSGANYPTGPGATGLFGRRSVLGFGARDWGGVTIGREYTPQFWVQLKGDIAANAYYGSLPNRSRHNSVRASNAIEYTSPSLAGVTLVALWSAGAVAANGGAEASAAPFDEGRQKGASIEYADERLFVAAAYGTTASKDGAAATFSVGASDATLVIKYRFDGVTLNASCSRVDPPGANNVIGAVIVGAMRRVTAVSQLGLQLSYSRQDAPIGRAPAEKTMSLHASYDLSKRTMLYANYARQANNSSSNQPLIASIGPNTIVPKTKGTTLSAFQLGMSHNF